MSLDRQNNAHQQEFPPLAGRLVTLSEAEARGFGSRPTLYRRIHAGTYRATKIEGSTLLIGDSLIEAVEGGIFDAPDAA